MFDEKDLILEAKHVTRRFPAAGGRSLVACNDVNLKMYRGKTLGLVGESGCGKSTFMRFLVWLDTPSEGEIWYRGEDITKLKGKKLWENRQHIQMVFQDPSTSFNPKMRIRDIVCEPLLNYGRIRSSEKDAKARELLEMVVTLPGVIRTTCPAASGRELPSRALWRWSLRSSSWMRRRAHWTFRCRRPSSS